MGCMNSKINISQEVINIEKEQDINDTLLKLGIIKNEYSLLEKDILHINQNEKSKAIKAN